MDKKQQKLLFYAAIAAGVYFMFFRKNKAGAAPTSAAMVGPAPAPQPAQGEGDPAGGLTVPTMPSGFIDINAQSGKQLLGLEDEEEEAPQAA